MKLYEVYHNIMFKCKLLNYYNLFHVMCKLQANVTKLFHVMCKLQANVTKLFNKKLLKLYLYAG